MEKTHENQTEYVGWFPLNTYDPCYLGSHKGQYIACPVCLKYAGNIPYQNHKQHKKIKIFGVEPVSTPFTS